MISIFIVVALASASFASAESFTDFIKRVTGQASSQPQNVSISVAGVNPVVVEVPTLSANPTENTFTTVSFTANVSDPNGVNDIIDSSVSPQISDGTTTRTGSCSWSQDISSTKANYSCSVIMWYFDPAGPSWNTRVQATDLGNGTLVNGTAIFTYGELMAMTISPSLLLWATVIPGSTNQMSTNDPTVISNTGNYNGLVSVRAINLLGETINTEMIVAGNFTSGPTSGSECSATVLSNATKISIAGSNSNPGNLSQGGGVGQEQIYYCIPSVPSVSSQIYSTTQGGSWFVEY